MLGDRRGIQIGHRVERQVVRGQADGAHQQRRHQPVEGHLPIAHRVEGRARRVKDQLQPLAKRQVFRGKTRSRRAHATSISWSWVRLATAGSPLETAKSPVQALTDTR